MWSFFYKSLDIAFLVCISYFKLWSDSSVSIITVRSFKMPVTLCCWGAQEVNAVLREQLLLQDCTACSLIVTVQADHVDCISANTHHALSLLLLRLCTGHAIYLLRKIPMLSHFSGSFAKRRVCITLISFKFCALLSDTYRNIGAGKYRTS